MGTVIVVGLASEARDQIAGALVARGHAVSINERPAGAVGSSEWAGGWLVAVDAQRDPDVPALVARIRAAPGGDALTVLVYGRGEPCGEMKRAVSAGADDFVILPRDAPLLATRLLLVERAGRARSPETRAGRGELDISAAVLETVAALVVVTDRDGVVLRWNRACERLTGCTLEQARRPGVWDLLLDPAEQLRGRGIFDALLAAPAPSAGAAVPSTHENEWITRDKRRRLLSWTNTTLRGDDGKIAYVIATGIDITDQRRSEDELRASEAIVRSLIDSAPLMMGVVEVVGEQITVVAMNRLSVAAASEMHVEIREKGAVVFETSDESRGYWLGLYAQAARSCGPVRGERTTMIGGVRIHFSITVAPIEGGAAPHPRYCYVVEDVTERRRLESSFLLADRMLSLGTLAAGVGHEVNKPLTYIIMNLAYVERELARLPPDARALAPVDELRTAAGRASEGAERVRQIIRQLRMLARGDQDERRVVEIAPLLKQTIVFAGDLLLRRARLLRELGPAPAVLANEAWLGQVFLNLLVNAAQAIPDGMAADNTIRVVTRTDERGWAVVEVHDSGTGMESSVLARIFDPFFTTREVGEELGLGLSICHGLVRGLGGAISVESEPGVGSVFRVALPPARGQVVKLSPPETLL